MFESQASPDSFSISHFVNQYPEGRTSRTVETLRKGGDLQDMDITFVSPDQFGLDTSKLGANQWAICANVTAGNTKSFRWYILYVIQKMV